MSDGIPVNRAVKLCGITYRQADHWIRLGLIEAEHPNGVGSGNLRELSHDEYRVMRIMARLIRAGMTPNGAAAIARSAVENEAHVVDAGEGIYVTMGVLG